jgi:5-formyltetrahydrofolate cyclo-ligase
MNVHKKELRDRALEERKRLHEDERRAKSQSVSERTISFIESRGLLMDGGSLFAFLPFGHEVDIVPVIEWCWGKGYPVAAPKTIREPRMLRLHQIEGMEHLQPGVWGIREPLPGTPLADPAAIAVVLVPGVLFDRNGGRIGYGGGYYDRLLSELHGKGIHPLRIAPAFDIQLRNELPLEPHDERMDIILTESQLIEGDGGSSR